MTGDGNCLFRSFSYIIFGTQSKHVQVQMMLVDLMAQNASYFHCYCHPSSVEEHTKRMRNNFTWGTHAEIFAMALYSQKPVFTAMENGLHDKYYWAQYKCNKKANTELVLPSSKIALPANLSHFEICHVNGNHYDVVLTAEQSISCTPPYVGESSACTSINLT